MPPNTPPVGVVKMYARDPISGDVYQVGSDASPSEVAIVNVDPYVTDANSKDELWLDTSKTPPILKGRVNNAWVEVTAATQPEVIVGGTIPTPGEDKLWLDPGGVMTPPTPGDPIKALWAYDGTAGPTNGWHKVEMGSSEVEVSAVDPITVNPEYELWVDTAPAPAPVPADEVFIGPDDPRVLFPNSEIEIWYDTDAVSLTAGEFLASATDPRLDPSGQTVELWLDTSTDPPVLKFWEENINPPGWMVVVEGGQFLPLSGGTLTGPLTATDVTVNGTFGARTSIAGAMQNSWTGSVNFTVNPAVVTAFIDASLPAAAVGSLPYKFCNIPAGVSGPRHSITHLVNEMTADYGVGARSVWVEARSDGLYAIIPGPNTGNAAAWPPLRLYTYMTWAR